MKTKKQTTQKQTNMKTKNLTTEKKIEIQNKIEKMIFDGSIKTDPLDDKELVLFIFENKKYRKYLVDNPNIYKYPFIVYHFFRQGGDLFDALLRNPAVLKFEDIKQRILQMDYDGLLVEFAKNPAVFNHDDVIDSIINHYRSWPVQELLKNPEIKNHKEVLIKIRKSKHKISLIYSGVLWEFEDIIESFVDDEYVTELLKINKILNHPKIIKKILEKNDKEAIDKLMSLLNEQPENLKILLENCFKNN